MKKKKELKSVAGDVSTRDTILHAAIQEFIEYGFYGARMQRIAQTSKVNKAMIYYYYSSKEQIYQEVLKNIFTTLFEKLNTLPVESSSVREMIGNIIDIYQNVFQEYPHYIKLFLYELASDGKNLKQMKLFDIKDLPFNPISGNIYKFFKQKIKENEIKKVDIFQLILSIISQIILPLVGKPLFDAILAKVPLPLPFSQLYQNLIKDRKEFIIDLIMNGIKK